MRLSFTTLAGIIGVSAVLLCGTTCTRLFHPCGSTEIPQTDQTEARLKQHVYYLADVIGERNAFHPGTMEQSAAYIERQLSAMGYEVSRQPVLITDAEEYAKVVDRKVYNLIVTKRGTDPNAKTLIVGAHFDTRVGIDNWFSHGPARPERIGTPGANDNASGIAALLETARALTAVTTKHDVCLVAYANEEPPFYQTDTMGSLVHAKSVAESPGKDKIIGMFTYETLGCYSPRKNDKRKAALVAGLAGLPDRCDYVAFLTTNRSKSFARACAKRFSTISRFPVRSASFPYFGKGVSWSDDWSYRLQGIPAFAITDTAFLRSDDYHEMSDTADKLDYPQFAEVTQGLIRLVISIANDTENFAPSGASDKAAGI